MNSGNPSDGPVAIIPARGGSKRLPRKNLAVLRGKPLLAYALDAALASGVFGMVVVSSEDEEIRAAALAHGAHAALARPGELATDTAQVKQVCAQVLRQLAMEGRPFREFGVLLTTNPLRTAQDLKTAYELFQSSGAHYLMSLVPFSHPPQRAVWAPGGYVEPFFGGQYMKQTQLLEPLYRHDGSIIFGKTAIFLEEGEFYGSKVAPYFIPPERSVDIDNPLDLAWAEFLLGRTGNQGREVV
jgi:CMP-N-acetylneuraminic acid synthetase